MNNNFPCRKSTRMKEYDYNSSGAYFVTVCIKDRHPILSAITLPSPANHVGDGAHDVPVIQLKPLGIITEKHLLASEKIPGVKIDQYVIMPDHIHAIIRITQERAAFSGHGTSRAPSPTNAMLPHIISTYKRLCHKEIGYVIFQRSYAEHIIRNRDEYDATQRYIAENPKRWLARSLPN